MSLNRKSALRQIAKERCRELRSRSTPGERVLWDALRNRRFGGLKFYRQHPLFHDLLGKETFFIADFYCHERRLVIEVDGTVHRYQKAQDALRTSVLNDMGITVIRVQEKGVVGNVEHVLSFLRRAILDNEG